MVEITNHDLIAFGFTCLSITIGYFWGYGVARKRRPGDRVD